jgi:UDP-glucose 4-epimerase
MIMLIWTIGSGGLIGGAIDAQSVERFEATAIPWASQQGSHDALDANIERFRRQAGENPWAIVWAAGAVTTSASRDDARDEVDTLRHFARQLRNNLPEGSGVIFFVSSAGGVHAGSANPPFDERSLPQPLGAYGEAKLAMETILVAELDGLCSVIIGRVSNVYGPGQKLEKLQGLISRLALCSARHEPVNLFVPISTVRDYMYVDDVAAAIHAWIEDSQAKEAPATTIRVIASGEGTSIAQLLRTVQDVTRRKVPVAMGTHPSARLQAPDLRFIPSVPEGVELPSTSLPIGIKLVTADILSRLQGAIA